MDDRKTALLLALVLFGVYLLSFSGRIYSSDGLSMFAVTESFVKRGDVTTDQMWTLFGTKSAPAPDGEAYSKYGYGTSLLAAPLYALALALPFVGLMQMTLVTSAVAVALTGGLVYLAARRLEFSRAASLCMTLLFGLATPAWVYAKEFWSEPYGLLTLFSAFYLLLRYRASRAVGDALAAGIALGLAVAVRSTNLILVPLYILYGFDLIRPAEPSEAAQSADEILRSHRMLSQNDSRRRWRALALFLVPIALFTLSVGAYNAIRFGSPLASGYRADETFSNPLLLGAYGLLFSPGKGLLVYAPFLAALPFGIWQMWQRAPMLRRTAELDGRSAPTHRRETAFMLALCGAYLVIFSAWYYWWGGTNWAARFLVPTLPFLALLCAPLIELILTPSSRAHRRAYAALTIVFALLILVSIVNELAGVSLSSLSYRLRMLRVSGDPEAAAIFLPEYSPLVGYWQMLKATNLDLAWARVVEGELRVDWLVVVLTVAFILCCAALLWQELRGKTLGRIALVGALFGAAALTLPSLARYADDPRLGNSAGYAELLATLQREAQARDVVVLNDDAHAPYWFNANRAAPKWYGLSRDPARWDAPTQELLARLVRSHPRIWFAYDTTVPAPNPMREWFAANLDLLREKEFADGVRLELYAGSGAP